MGKEIKEHWDSRTAFILASVGSAVGLGNIWRFPYIVYKYGGGAFIIPFLVALLTAGIPLLILEFTMGHKTNRAAPGSFAFFNKKMSWIGWAAVFVGMGVTIYYAAIMAWSGIYFFKSFSLGWGQATESFFYNSVIHLSSGPTDIGSFLPLIFIGIIFTWIWIYFSIIKGAKSVGKMVYITVILPWLILIVLIIRGVTLPGAMTGLAYLFTPNFAALADPEVWINAYSQVFFSISIGFGVMIAYGSFLPKKADIVNSAFIIGLADAATSLLASVAIFSALGYLALQRGVDVCNVVASGPGLAFVTYPEIINLFPVGAAVLGALFFAMLLTFGIDSAFSLVEAFSAAAVEKWNISRLKLNAILGIVGITLGTIFATQSALYWLDIIDHYLSVYGLVIVGILECIVVGYFIKPDSLRLYANEQSDFSIGRWWNIIIKYFLPIVLIAIVIWNIWSEIQHPYEGYAQGPLLVGIGILILAFALGILMSITKERSA